MRSIAMCLLSQIGFTQGEMYEIYSIIEDMLEVATNNGETKLLYADDENFSFILNPTDELYSNLTTLYNLHKLRLFDCKDR